MSGPQPPGPPPPGSQPPGPQPPGLPPLRPLPPGSPPPGSQPPGSLPPGPPTPGSLPAGPETQQVAGPYAYAPEPAKVVPPAEAAAEQRRSHFRPDIEGLRAVAVIAVVLFHVGLPGVTGGFVGVDVFYVISGFLITGLLLREGEASGRVDLVKFYARRMRRLLPAALVVIVVTLVASAAILSPLRLTEVAGDAAASALYVANFRFALEATDYLAVGAPSPFLHFWSLAVEEQFYLFWPLLLLVAARLLTLRFLGVFVLIVAIASFALSLYLTQVNQPWAFFMLPARAWELAAGALIAVGLVRVPSRAPRWTAGAVVWAGLALIVASAMVIGAETPFPGVAAVLPVLGAVLVIAGGMRVTLPGRLLALAPMRYVGRISYSLYLWHWPILILVPIALGTDSLLLRIGLAFVAVLFAAVSTELIERPFRRGSFLNKRPSGAVKLGLASSVAVAVSALVVTGAVDVPNPFFKRDPAVVELAGVRDDLPQNYADDCHLSFIEDKPKNCAYGDRESKKIAYLFGDSHAAQWLPALDVIAKEQGWRLVTQTKAACSPVPVTLWERKLRRLYDECHKWRQTVMDQIAKVEPEIVFVGNSRDYEIWNDGSVDRVVDSFPQWERQLTTLLKQLDERAGKVVLLAETPFLNFDPVDCLAQIKEFGGCDPPRFLVVDARYAAVEDAAVQAADVSMVSINELLCPGSNCPVVVDGASVYRDRNHVTATHMAKLAGPISEYLAGRDPTTSPEPA